MSSLDDPAARAAAARKIAQDTGGRLEPKDPLSEFERDHYFASESAQLRLPLRNRTEVCTHLAMMIESLTGLRDELTKRPRGERSDLLIVASTVRGLNHKLNAYRLRKRSKLTDRTQQAILRTSASRSVDE